MALLTTTSTAAEGAADEECCTFDSQAQEGAGAGQAERVNDFETSALRI
jgi:hypothetical protein